MLLNISHGFHLGREKHNNEKELKNISIGLTIMILCKTLMPTSYHKNCRTMQLITLEKVVVQKIRLALHYLK
jgi:hypothetical protein